MAKHKVTTMAAHAKEIEKSKPADDDGYEKVADGVELDGYWSPERGPLHGTLIGGFEFIQKSGQGAGERSRAYVFRLESPCEGVYHTYSPDGRRQELTDGTLETGSIVGVFDSAGLRPLQNLKGASIKLSRAKEKRVLKSGNSMWVFDIRSKGKGEPLVFDPPLGEGDGVPY